MPFPPDPPWHARRDFETVWAMHLARHDRELAALVRQHATHEREHDQALAAYQRDRAADTAARALERSGHAREHELTQRALDKAEAATDQRFRGVNEFRQTLTDQAATFARSETVDAHLQALTTRMDTTERNQNERRETLTEQLGARITVLEKYQSATVGQVHGASVTVGWIFGAIGMLSGLAGLLSRFIQ